MDQARTFNSRTRDFRTKSRGVAAVEFALVAPLFLLFLFGMIEFGRMVMVQQVLTNAAREGARIAALDGATATSVIDTVVHHATQAAVTIDPAGVTITPNNPGDAGYGEPVEVSVAVEFDQVSWLPAPMYLGGKSLIATTVMRREGAQ